MKLSYLVVVVVVLLFSFTACQKRSADSSQASGLRKIHFDFDSSSIRPDMVPILDNNQKYLKNHKGMNVVVEGHCDERGTNEYNLALGDRRAQSTKIYLVNRGVKEDSLRTVSYGEERSIAFGADESAWYMNRRAEFVK